MSKVLYATSEAFPLIKTGGLGDVAGSLPKALQKKSQDIRIVLPAYTEVLDKITTRKILASKIYYDLSVDIIETRLPGSNVKVYLIDCPALFHRPGSPYMDEHGVAWPDNALRFSVFCHSVVDISLGKFNFDWTPDIVHCNDWQTGLIPALLSLSKIRPASIFTIHNLAYQGIFQHKDFTDLKLPNELWHMDGVEFYGNFSFLKGGISYADKITTVSENYAKEILSPEFGYGLDGLLRHRAEQLSGILNGIDEKYWNPGTDPYLSYKYNKRTINKKSLNKTELQSVLSLPIDISTPMVGMVSRLVEQKGLELILQSLETLLSLPLQLVILGTGDLHYELKLCQWAKNYPDKLKVIIGYDESLAHKIEAGSDLFLMPSTFEPCGLNQLYSLRYGTLPIVTNTGGLADTVIDANETNITNGTANGFVLTASSTSALITTIKYALSLYNKPGLWQKLQITAMNGDFSWQSSAEHYIKLYQQVLSERQKKLPDL